MVASRVGRALLGGLLVAGTLGVRPAMAGAAAICPPDDGFEQNDGIKQSTPITAGQAVNGIACDEDWFAFNVPAGRTVEITLTFTHANGDLDMEMLDSEEIFLAVSDSVDDNEFISYRVSRSDIYHLVVYPFGNQVSNNYLLTVAIVDSYSATTDFDGDGDTDRSVFRNGAWYAESQTTQFLGQAGDIPVPGDYDGNGETERAVYRDGTWFIEGRSNAFHGTAGDVPVPADYDGDGLTDIAIYRPPVGGWYIQGQTTVLFGLATDIPVPGDYDNDGDADPAVWRPSVGGWYVSGGATQFLGLNGDIPVPGDYDGNGDTERGIWRPSVGGWYIEGQATEFLGLNGDRPVPGDYNGDLDTERASWRPAAGGWYVEDVPAAFLGLSGDVPLPLPNAIYRSFF